MQRLYRPVAEKRPAYVANGLIGLRVPPVPLGGTAMLNGFVHRCPDIGIEAAAPLPYPLALVIAVDGVSTKRCPEAATPERQHYDFATGELASYFTVRGREATAHVETVTFCSRRQPTLALQRTTLTVDRPCRVVFAPEANPEGLPGRVLDRVMPNSLADMVLHFEGEGAMTSCGIAVSCRLRGVEAGGASDRNDWGFERGVLACQLRFEAQPGQSYVLDQYAACVPSVLHGEPHWQAVRHVREATTRGFDRLLADNRAAWAELWRGRIVIDADGPWQGIADAAFFYGHSSVHAASPLSVAPFGLSGHRFYHGHVFWDCETFLFPFLLLTAPAAARSILDYRSARLEPARNLARLLGQRGLCFPWQSGLRGDEVTPLPYVQMQERHIGTDVAFAFAQYAHATADDLFMRQQTWPVLQGVADWIASAVVRTGRGYELLGVTGIDESREDVANNSYTNMSAAVVLREAAAMAERLGLRPPSPWREIAEGLVLARDAATGAILNCDGYDIARCGEGWPACPETLAGFFPMTYRAAAATEAVTYHYYLNRVHESQGMPMLSTLAPTWAARTGDRALARRMLEDGVPPFLREPFLMFAELGRGREGFSGDDATCYMATLGGYLLTCLYGLPGLQLDAGEPRAWGKFPVMLPTGWQEIEVERLWIRGQPWRLRAVDGAAAAELCPLAANVQAEV